LHAFGRLHGPIDLIEALIRLVGSGTFNDNL
jgi:hypothetical protein